MNTPIIKIEFESMRQCLLHAFSDELVKLDHHFRVAVEDACQPEKVQAVLTDAANKYMKQALEEETKSYFMYGDGRKAIAAKVKERLDAQNWANASDQFRSEAT